LQTGKFAFLISQHLVLVLCLLLVSHKVVNYHGLKFVIQVIFVKFMNFMSHKNYQHMVFNYACLQVLVNSNTYMGKQLCYCKYLCSHMQAEL